VGNALKLFDESNGGSYKVLNNSEQLQQHTVHQVWMKKIKCDASWEQEISFGLAFLHRMQRLAKGTVQYKCAIDWQD
jgi:hypothetical protein